MIANFSPSVITRPLKIVAYVFLLGGIFSVIDTVVELFMGRINFNLGILYIVVGLGLLRFNPRSLAWARFFTWIGLITLPVAAIASLFLRSRFQVFGLDVGQMPQGVGFALCMGVFALLGWQHSVLKDRQVLRLFNMQS